MKKTATVVLHVEVPIVEWPTMTEDNILQELDKQLARIPHKVQFTRIKVTDAMYTSGNGVWSPLIHRANKGDGDERR